MDRIHFHYDHEQNISVYHGYIMPCVNYVYFTYSECSIPLFAFFKEIVAYNKWYCLTNVR